MPGDILYFVVGKSLTQAMLMPLVTNVGRMHSFEKYIREPLVPIELDTPPTDLFVSCQS